MTLGVLQYVYNTIPAVLSMLVLHRWSWRWMQVWDNIWNLLTSGKLQNLILLTKYNFASSQYEKLLLDIYPYLYIMDFSFLQALSPPSNAGLQTCTRSWCQSSIAPHLGWLNTQKQGGEEDGDGDTKHLWKARKFSEQLARSNLLLKTTILFYFQEFRREYLPTQCE